MSNDLLVEEREVNNLLDNGINKIKQIIDKSNTYSNGKYYYSNSPMLSEISINNLYNEKDDEINTVEQHHGANIEKLHYKNIELNDYLYEIKKANAELIHFIGLQKNDFRELGFKYQTMSEDFYNLFDRYKQSEEIREEQIKLIETMQNEVDSLRGKAVSSSQMFMNNHRSIDFQNEESYINNYDSFKIKGGKYKTLDLEQEKETKPKTKKKISKNPKQSTTTSLKKNNTKNIIDEKKKSTSKLKISTINNNQKVKK
jgi:hypothetical protein